MEKIVLYESFDGRQFRTEFECIQYELNKRYENSTLAIYDKFKIRLNNVTSKDTYSDSRNVVVKSVSDLALIGDIRAATGLYNGINDIGIWEWFDGRWELMEQL